MYNIELKSTTGKISKLYIGRVIGMLDDLLPARRVIMITDSNLHRLHRGLVERFEHIIVGIGETNKTLSTIEMIYDRLIDMEADRNCFIIGFGGGIVTDIAGFAASTFMRGLPFGYIPSTLLSQVDASVGGKNGVNVRGYKNMAGTFNQPDFVLCDTDLLKTLPPKEFASGMAEVIKAAIVGDEELLEILEKNDTASILNDEQLLAEIISRALKVKIRIVENDEKELGQRKLLNLGHTFGHAIENCYPDQLHGYAVAKGILMASLIGRESGMTDDPTANRIASIIEKYELDSGAHIDPRRILKSIRHDKKRSGDLIDIIIPEAIGRCSIVRKTFDELDKSITDIC